MNGLLLAAVILASPLQVDHTFIFKAEGPLQSVNLAGTFNGWNAQTMPMTLGPDGRTWTRTLSLEPGKHYYKFVLDGSNWIVDPKAMRNEDDGNGNVNSVLVIWPEGYDTPARMGDGHITRSTLQHSQEMPLLNWDRGRLHVSFRARPNDVQKVELVTAEGASPMRLVSQDDLYAMYQIQVPWSLDATGSYAFRLVDGSTTLYYGKSGVANSREGAEFVISPENFRPFTPPSWVEGSVIYQIFPERFENGDPSNDPENVEPWDAEPKYWNFLGGDFAGVKKRIDYLKDLGVDAIYFNPVFESPANHRYEATDFYLIDHRLGTNQEFLATLEALDSNGIRVVLDGVFNHTATTFPQFEDIMLRGKDSPYVDWFYIKEFPVVVKDPPPYEAWFGFPSMPKVNLYNEDAKEYMLRVGEYWVSKAGIDGWRLDVANEVPMEFWRVFRERIKAADPEAWIVGEVWGDGSAWLKGDQWDSVMNYRFRFPTIDWIAENRTKPSQYMAALMDVHADYGPQVSRNMMNLLGSHDTPRWLTVCGGDEQLAALGKVMQFTWIGAPSIYYGDELGMEGGADPANRRGMQWELADEDNGLLNLTRELIAIRKSSKALMHGDPLPLLTDDAQNTLAFARVFEDDHALVVVNRSESEREIVVPVRETLELANGTFFEDRLTGNTFRVEAGSVRVLLKAKSAAILLPAGAQTATATTPIDH